MRDCPLPTPLPGRDGTTCGPRHIAIRCAPRPDAHAYLTLKRDKLPVREIIVSSPAPVTFSLQTPPAPVLAARQPSGRLRRRKPVGPGRLLAPVLRLRTHRGGKFGFGTRRLYAACNPEHSDLRKLPPRPSRRPFARPEPAIMPIAASLSGMNGGDDVVVAWRLRAGPYGTGCRHACRNRRRRSASPDCYS